MSAGYDWLLNRTGLDPEWADHAAHLDDRESAEGCTLCLDGAR